MLGKYQSWTVVVLFFCSALSECQTVSQPGHGSATSQFAWRLFLYVSQPYGHDKVLWQDWATVKDVFGDPNREPRWSGRSREPFTHEPILQMILLQAANLSKPPAQAEIPVACSVDLTEQDVRLNRDAVTFIGDHKLWYLEGQEAAFEKGEDLSFPPGTIEIKAMWRPITNAEKDLYFSVTSGGSIWGLDGLHITSKLFKDWIWVTFEHENSNCRCRFVDCHDEFGAMPADGRDTQPTRRLQKLFERAGMKKQWLSIWKHYKLDGIQTSFTHRDGTVTILGNSLAEAQFGNKSSCITCHSRATISSDGGRLALTDKDCVGFVGRPLKKWFADGGKRKFLQMDFVWSLINAKSSANMKPALPSGCEEKPER